MPFGKVPEISPQELAAALASEDPPRLVDARTGWEYNLGTIAGAEFTPLTDMPAVMARRDWRAGQRVVVLCFSGHRSRPGTRWLRAQGIEAYSLQGGIAAWRLAGYPLAKPDTAEE